MVKKPLLPLPSTATIVNDATISAVGSIPPLPLSTMTAIATVDKGRVRAMRAMRAMKARIVVVVVGSGGKDAIITTAINHRHS